jgi:hypothetical protein
MEASGTADAVLAVRACGGLDFGEGTFSPSVRVAVSRSFDVERVAPPGRAALRWTTVALDACPVRFDVSAAPTIEVRPCIGFAAGVLEAEAAAVPVPQSRTRPWLAASAHLRLVWAPVRALAVELEGGAVAPLSRESFFFEPAIPVYEAPAVAAFGRAGMAVRFP